jgi:CHAT domain-containing protein
LSQQSKSPEEEWRSLYGLARISRNRDQARSALASIEQLRSGIGTTTLKSDFLADKSEVFDFTLALDFEANDPTSAFHTIERSRALALREALPTKPTLLTLQQFQSRLTKDEAALRLEVGKTESYALWITPTRTHLERLPITEKQASNPNPAILFRNALWPAKRLWIIPDGPLALIPLEPLFPKLIETAYLPAAWFLEAPKLATKHIHFPWQLEVAAYSSPTINTQNLLPGDEVLAPLPNSTKEVEAIARILPGHTNLYTQATLSQLATAPILHLATHAIADPESAQRNRILLGNTYLYATQLKPNSLPNTELAVLSACDTSLGPQLRGEGVQSLSRAFLAAGANATIASYWKVDDRSTRILMETLYRNLTQGLSYSEALHQTRLTLQKQNSDPRIWAAFTVQGAARDTLPRFISWPQLLSAAAAMLALTAYVFNKLRAPQAQ